MSFTRDIEQRLIQAMKEKNELVLATMRMLKSAIANKAIELMKKELTDEEALAVVRNEIKKRDDSIEAYRAGGRQELADKEAAEKEILKKFLTPEMSADEIKETGRRVRSALAEADQSNFGKVMAAVMKELKGKADGKAVGEAVKALLAEEVGS
jgi:uncharacterized protein YqeY